MSAKLQCSEGLSKHFGQTSDKLPTDLLIKVSAPGKVILHGEHSVVYGKLAFAASLGLRTKLTLDESKNYNGDSNSISIHLKDLNLMQSYDINHIQRELLDKYSPISRKEVRHTLEKPELVNHEELLRVAENFVKKHSGPFALHSYQNIALVSLFYLFAGILGSVDIDINPFTISLETDLTIGAGTGSSASYLVTLATAFIQYARIKANFDNKESLKNGHKNVKSCSIKNPPQFEKKDLEFISKWAYNAEQIVHGSASGVDNTVCTFGSMVEFRKGSPPKVIQLASKFRVLLVNSMVSRNTKMMVDKLAETRKEHQVVVDLVLDAIEKVTQGAFDTIIHLSMLGSPNQPSEGDHMQDVRADYKKLGKLTDMNQSLLATLGVSHPKLDQICWTLRDAGLHGKLTGAGGGGYAIALIPPFYPDNDVKLLTEKLEADGFEVYVTDLGGPGVVLDELRMSS